MVADFFCPEQQLASRDAGGVVALNMECRASREELAAAGLAKRG